jgi:hypothetical protein
MSQESSVNKATGQVLGKCSSASSRGGIFSLPPHPNWLLPRSRRVMLLPPLPYMSSHNMVLKHRDNFTFSLLKSCFDKLPTSGVNSTVIKSLILMTVVQCHHGSV